MAAKAYEKKTIAFDLEKDWIDDLEAAVYASKISSYAQGLALLKQASEEWSWDLDLSKIAQIWENGCIIRADLLREIRKAFDKEGHLANLLLAETFKETISKEQIAWRKICAYGALAGIYMPSISASLNYFDGYTSERTSANLLQAQRDLFGAHTYQRVDAPYDQNFHTIWEG